MALFGNRVVRNPLEQQRQKAFGFWRSFLFTSNILSVLGIFGALVGFVTSITFFGLSEYAQFAIFAALLVWLMVAEHKAQKREKENSGRKAVYALALGGLALILFGLATGYIDEHWQTGGRSHVPGSSNASLIMAIAMRRFMPDFMQAIAPGYEENRKSKTFIQRLGILALSCIALLPFLDGWLVVHVVAKAFMANIIAVYFAEIIFAVVPCILFVMLVRELLKNGLLTPSGLRFGGRVFPLTLLLTLAIGGYNGILTSSVGRLAASKTDVQIILYAVLFTEVLSVLTLWYILLIIPRYYGEKPAQQVIAG